MDTAATTVMLGVVIFVIQNMILKLAIEPTKDFKKLLASTSVLILENLPSITGANSSDEISACISNKSAFILSECELIMCYALMQKIYKLPSKGNLLKICHNLNTISYNMKPEAKEFMNSPAFNAPTKDLAAENHKLIQEISVLLKIKVTY